MSDFLELLALSSPYEFIAVVLAIAYVVLAIRQSIWCWPAAVGSAGIYAVLFLDGRLYMESLLQLVYVLMAFYGFWKWRFGGAGDQQLPIQRRSLNWHIKVLVVATLIVIVSALTLLKYTDADAVWLDTATTVFSLFTTYMVARKVLENWLYWIVINTAYVFLFWSKGYHPTSILFMLYVVMAALGYLQWRKDYFAAARREASAGQPANDCKTVNSES